MPPATHISELVKELATQAGFDLAGIAPVENFHELEFFRHWIAQGYAGEMRYLESRDEAGELKRGSLARVAPWARSVIVGAVNYHVAAPGIGGGNDPERGWISCYAWSRRDYHDVVMERLRRLEDSLRAAVGGDLETRCYVDTGPIVERVWAQYAGVGWVGKNTCIINQKLGSWLFLGVLLTSLELTPDFHPSAPDPSLRSGRAPRTASPAPDRCGTCTRCLDACPTNAFLGPRQLDATRCISYLTIEKRGPIPEDLRAGVGRNVFGCDICQDVCPWNRRAPQAASPDFQPRPELVNPPLPWLATISEEDFRTTFRGSPVKRARRIGLRRNAVVAMGNSGQRDFLGLLEELAHDPDETVAEHARWALFRVTGNR